MISFSVLASNGAFILFHVIFILLCTSVQIPKKEDRATKGYLSCEELPSPSSILQTDLGDPEMRLHMEKFVLQLSWKPEQNMNSPGCYSNTSCISKPTVNLKDLLLFGSSSLPEENLYI